MKRMIWNTVITGGLLGAALLVVGAQPGSAGAPDCRTGCLDQALDVFDECVELGNDPISECRRQAAGARAACMRFICAGR